MDYEKLRNQAYVFALKKIMRVQEAEDFAQEYMVRVLKSQALGRKKPYVNTAWVDYVRGRRGRQYYKKKNHLTKKQIFLDPQTFDDKFFSSPPHNSPEHMAYRSQQWEFLKRADEFLIGKEKLFFEQHLIKGLNTREIADLWGVSENWIFHFLKIVKIKLMKGWQLYVRGDPSVKSMASRLPASAEPPE